MIYSKLEGTTSQSFKLGKKGVGIANNNGQLEVIIPSITGEESYRFLIGVDEIDPSLDQNDIPNMSAIMQYVADNITGDLGDYSELLQTLSGVIDAIDNDPDFYQHVLRLQDTDGNAVDGQSVKGTTTFEKDVTFEGEIHGPENFVIDPQAVGDNSGTVIIRGDLQVEGTTTTLNSTVVDIYDSNITLAKGAENAAAAEGAGITIDGADASLVYDSTSDTMQLNKGLVVTDGINQTTIASDGSVDIGSDTDIGGNLDVTGVITSGGERVLTSIAGGGQSTGEAITSATIEDGEVVFETDTFVHVGSSGSSIPQDIYGEKTFKSELNADAGIVTTTLESTVETGTAPLTVASTTVVTNLNADKLDGADLDTSVTDSDAKVPTAKAVLTYSVPKNISAMPSLTFSDARKTSQKDNTYVYVYNEATGESKKISLSEIHRPSVFIIDSETTGAASELTITKTGDFVYIKEE